MTRRRCRRSQAGMTLLELMLAATISVIIVVPVTAWFAMSVRAQGVANDALDRSNATGLLRAALSRDVASAARVWSGGVDCPEAPDGGGLVRLQIVPASGERRIVYTESPAEDDPSRVSLWRQECSLGTNKQLAAGELIRDVRPGSTVGSCPPADASGGEDPCQRDDRRRVELRTVPLTRDGVAGQEIAVRALRRTSSASTGLGGADNLSPLANVTASSQAVYAGAPVVFSAEGSTDDDGIERYRWTVPDDAKCEGDVIGPVRTCTFDAASGERSRSVSVTVTDWRGAAHTATTTIMILNRNPLAVAKVVKNDDGSFDFDGTGSSDPESPSTALTYTWDFGDDMGDLRYRSGPVVEDVLFPAGGETLSRQVTLVLVDPDGGVDAAVVTVDVDPGGEGVGGSDIGAGSSGINIEPKPVLVPNKLPRVATVGGGDDSVEVMFTSADGAPVQWQLLHHGTTQVVAASDGTTSSWPRTFGLADAGEYDIVRMSGGSGAAVRSFRINRAPAAAFTASGTGSAPLPVNFLNSSSDGDGSIVSYRWDFGFFGWTSTNPNPVHVFTNPGVYVVRLEVVDDEGARSYFFRALSVGGIPFQPPKPDWDGDTALIAAVPGAEEYRFTFRSLCDSQRLVRNQPEALLPFACSTGVDVTVETRANGQWSKPSDPAVRP
jgi:type II secretory pathway pseudopilin PulG